MKLSIIAIILTLYLSLLQSSVSLDVEIEKDFNLTMQYRLETQSFEWNDRGVVSFLVKGKSKSHQSGIEVYNDKLTKEMKDQISKECNAKGTYYIRFSNVKTLLYSSVDPCDLIRNKFKDKITINSASTIKEDNIMSINYSIDVNPKESKSKKERFETSINLVPIQKSEGPIFSNEEEEKKTQEETKKEQSFLSKYWWIILPLGIMMLMGGNSGEEEGQERAQQAN